MRLFVGIEIAEEIRQRLLEHRNGLQRRLPDSRIKWTRPEGWHITLKFIGETETANEIKEVLAQVEHTAFEIAVRRTGFFTPNAPRIYFAGVEAPAGLADLAARVDRAVAGAGVPVETRPFSPHLTLARSGSGRPHPAWGANPADLLWPLARLLQSDPRLTQVEFGTMTALEFHLYKSEPAGGGSKYTKLASYGLDATDADRA